MDFAASSVLRNASTLPISGFAAPATTMPIRERASSTLLPARTTPRLPQFVGGAAIDDHDVRGLASREAGGNGLGRFTHRWAARRDQAVAARALERRAQLGIDLIETGRDHHLQVGRRHRARDQQRGDSKTESSE